MKNTILIVLLFALCGLSSTSQAISESEAEEIADLTAVFVFLKNECGYKNLPNAEIKRAIVYFAQQNRWDLSNYNNFNMNVLGEDSYHDLSGIAISKPAKCHSLARNSLMFIPAAK